MRSNQEGRSASVGIASLGLLVSACTPGEPLHDQTHKPLGGEPECHIALALIDLAVPPEPSPPGSGPFLFEVTYVVGPTDLPVACTAASGGVPPGGTVPPGGGPGKGGGVPDGPAAMLRTVLDVETSDARFFEERMLLRSEIRDGVTVALTYAWDGLDSEEEPASGDASVIAYGFISPLAANPSGFGPSSDIADAFALFRISDEPAVEPTPEQVAAVDALRALVLDVPDDDDLSADQRAAVQAHLADAFPDFFDRRREQLSTDKDFVSGLVSPLGVPVSAAQIAAWDALFEDSRGAVGVAWDPVQAAPFAVSFGGTRALTEPSFEADAEMTLFELRPLLAMASEDHFVHQATRESAERAVVRFERVVGGYPVIGDAATAVYVKEGSSWFLRRIWFRFSPLPAGIAEQVTGLVPAQLGVVQANIEGAVADLLEGEPFSYEITDDSAGILPAGDSAPIILDVGPAPTPPVPLVRVISGVIGDPTAPDEADEGVIALVAFDTGDVLLVEPAGLGDMTVAARLSVPHHSPTGMPMQTETAIPHASVCPAALEPLEEYFCPSLDYDGSVPLPTSGPDQTLQSGDPAYLFPRDWRFGDLVGFDLGRWLATDLPGGITTSRTSATFPFPIVNSGADASYKIFPVLATASSSDQVVTIPLHWENDVGLLTADPALLDERTRAWALQAHWWVAYASEVWQWDGTSDEPVRTRFGFYDKADRRFAHGVCGQWLGLHGLIHGEDMVRFWILDDGVPIDCRDFFTSAATIPHELGHRIGEFTAMSCCGFLCTGRLQSTCSAGIPLREGWADFVTASLTQGWGVHGQIRPFRDGEVTKPNWGFRGNQLYRSVNFDRSRSIDERRRRAAFDGAWLQASHLIGAKKFDGAAVHAVRSTAGLDGIIFAGKPEDVSLKLAYDLFAELHEDHHFELARALMDHDWVPKVTLDMLSALKKVQRPPWQVTRILSMGPMLADDYSNSLTHATPIDGWQSVVIPVTVGGSAKGDPRDTFRFYAHEGRTYVIRTQNTVGVDPMLMLWRHEPAALQRLRLVAVNQYCDQQVQADPTILPNAGTCVTPGGLDPQIRYRVRPGDSGWHIIELRSRGKTGPGTTELLLSPGIHGSAHPTGAPLLLSGDQPLVPPFVRREPARQHAILTDETPRNFWTIPVMHRDCLAAIRVTLRNVFAIEPDFEGVHIQGATSDLYSNLPRSFSRIGDDLIVTYLISNATLSPLADAEGRTSGIIRQPVLRPAGAGVLPYEISSLELHFCPDNDRTDFDRPFVIRRTSFDSRRTEYHAYTEYFDAVNDADHLEVFLEEGEHVAISVVGVAGAMIDVDHIETAALRYMTDDKWPACYESTPLGPVNCPATGSAADAERGFLFAGEPVLDGEDVSRRRPNVTHLSFTAPATGTYRVRLRPYKEEYYPYRLPPLISFDTRTNDEFERMPSPYQVNIAIAAARQEPRPPFPRIIGSPTVPGP
jgi:hypothetical protein